MLKSKDVCSVQNVNVKSIKLHSVIVSSSTAFLSYNFITNFIIKRNAIPVLYFSFSSQLRFFCCVVHTIYTHTPSKSRVDALWSFLRSLGSSYLLLQPALWSHQVLPPPVLYASGDVSGMWGVDISGVCRIRLMSFWEWRQIKTNKKVALF